MHGRDPELNEVLLCHLNQIDATHLVLCDSVNHLFVAATEYLLHKLTNMKGLPLHDVPALPSCAAVDSNCALIVAP